ncbi:WcaA Glycosyltransferases involved in cell wall biogenesis [Burkholderiaceae bacterium]
MSTPRLSILIPTYNRCELLDECLKRLVLSGYCNEQCEINVSDNASSDATKNVVSKYNVNYQCNEENLGFSGNIEVLLKSAKGKYIIIMGDDDEFLVDWSCVKLLLEVDFDLCIFGIEKGILSVDCNLNCNLNKLPFGFIGDSIQKNSNTFKDRFRNYKGRSSSPHFFARIDVFILKGSKICHRPNELIRRFELPEKNTSRKNLSIFKIVKNFFIRPLDYGYCWYEARKELKLYYPADISMYWVGIIDQAHDYTRQQHLKKSGLLRVLYYWFFQLYLRGLIFPGFTLYIVKTIIKAISVSNIKSK